MMFGVSAPIAVTRTRALQTIAVDNADLASDAVVSSNQTGVEAFIQFCKNNNASSLEQIMRFLIQDAIRIDSNNVRYHTRMAAKSSDEYDRFTKLVDRVLSVPHAEIQRRQEEYRRQSEANPRRRGPKPKASASRAPGVS